MIESSKALFAFKVALAFCIAYMIPIASGWSDVSTAAVTVMLIAAASSLNESIQKGLIRVVGTVFGAGVGIVLVALFPQERFLYLFFLSLVVALCAYLYFAYKGDGTAFMLTALTAMLVRTENVNDTLIYGVEKSLMTTLGIVIFTLIFLFLFPKNVVISSEKKMEKEGFFWFDAEALKGAFVVFSLYWSAILFWIYFHPSGGFFVVILAVALSFLTTFSPDIKPHILAILYTVGFLFATVAYIFILPNLVYGWQLALFLFGYAFITFLLIPAQITFFFLIGVLLMGIANEMYYNFAIYLQTLLLFYIFLLFLLFFHYFPFSSKVEDVLYSLHKRVSYHLQALQKLSEPNSAWQKFLKAYHERYLHHTAQKFIEWLQALDRNYFGIEVDIKRLQESVDKREYEKLVGAFESKLLRESRF